MSRIKTIFIVGPTASGKTALSIEIAKKFGGEIISADSMQIYKGIHIASAAPDEVEKDGVPHHLIEFLEPTVVYSVADYVINARKCIEEVAARGKLPIVVGGTGLYINALTDNIAFTDATTSKELREELEKQFDLIGGEGMLKELSLIDKDAADRLHPSDRRRIIRAFEVFRLTGNTITEQNIESKTKIDLVEPLIIGITCNDREKLYNRIDMRVDIMIKNGLLNEAKNAYNNKFGGAFQAIGHKELFGYFDGELSLEEAVDSLKRQTRRYAKRQLTWFRKDQRINWFYTDETENSLDKIQDLINSFLN